MKQRRILDAAIPSFGAVQTHRGLALGAQNDATSVARCCLILENRGPGNHKKTDPFESSLAMQQNATFTCFLFLIDECALRLVGLIDPAAAHVQLSIRSQLGSVKRKFAMCHLELNPPSVGPQLSQSCKE